MIRKERDKDDHLFEELRKKAEALINSGDKPEISYADIKELVYELQVYHIELEIQNETLRTTRDELYESRNMYQKLFDSAPVGYFVLDLDTTILDGNLAGLEMQGRQKSLIINKQFSTYIHGGDKPLLWEHLRDLRSNSARQECELRVRREGGDYYWAHLTLSLLNREMESSGEDPGEDSNVEERILATMFDISDRKEYEKKLIEINNEYTGIVETANSIIAKIDLSGRLIFINRYGLDILGSSEKEVLGEKVVGTIFPEVDTEGRDLSLIMEEMLRNPGGFSYEFEMENLCSDGKKIWVLYRNREIRDQEGNIIGLLAVGQDITQRKKAEDIIKRDKKALEKLVEKKSKELVTARAEAEEGKRLRDLGRMSASIAHELRNPLAAMKLSLQNIRRKQKNPELEKHLNHCEEKINQSDYIINNLLKSSSLTSPNFEDTDLCSIINQCVEELISQYKNKEIQVIKKLTALEDRPVWADTIQMMEVVNNIVKNAFDTVPAEKGVVEITGFVTDESMGFSVKDNDKGIPEEEIPKVTEPFYTKKSRGTGLGLSISKEILSSHGGFLDIKSTLGEGTTVRVTLSKKQ